MTAMTTLAGANNYTVHLDAEGNQVYPCRCGETHVGEWAIFQFGHHNCLHGEWLLIPPSQLVCRACGAGGAIVQTLQLDDVSGRHDLGDD